MTKFIAILLLIITISTAPAFAFIAKTTSYTGSEDGNYRNCSGDKLQEGMIAADLSIYPIGTKISINGEVFTVADCGSAIKGRKHFDIFCSSMKKMNQRGTIYADVQVLNPTNPHQTLKVAAKPILTTKNDHSSAKSGANSKIFQNTSLHNQKFTVYSSKRSEKMFNKQEEHEILICDNE